MLLVTLRGVNNADFCLTQGVLEETLLVRAVKIFFGNSLEDIIEKCCQEHLNRYLLGINTWYCKTRAKARLVCFARSGMSLTSTILLYLVSLQSSKVAETNAERTRSRRREHCYDHQANQDPQDAKHTTQNKLGGFVSVAEN